MVRGKRAENGSTRQRKAKTKADAPGAQGSLLKNSRATTDERTDEQLREGFHQHRKSWNAAQAKIAAANKILSEVKKSLKADGYLVKHFTVADDLATPTGNKRIDTTLKVHREALDWMGDARGKQMAFAFSQPDRTPSVESAYDAGKLASMEDKPCRPPHAPATEQYTQWIKGWQDHQGKLAKGFKAPKDTPTDAPVH